MRPKYLSEAPKFGEIVNIAPNIDWLRLPLPMALDHINIYLLRDEDGYTVVDTGVGTTKLMEMWSEVIAKLDAPVKRLLVTHYHPDHIGLAGWFVETYDVEFITSRLTYTLTRMLQMDVQKRPRHQQYEYWKRAGYDQDWLDERMNKRPFNFLDSTTPLPYGVKCLLEGQVFHAAGRDWVVRFGSGHAPDHLTLWNDEFVLIGDHCLPAITPVISVFSTEPQADPLSEFVETTKKLAQYANDEQVFLPGHNRPFRGGRSRMMALAEHHEETLDRIREALCEPKTMVDCYPLLFRRKITPDLEGFAISEATAHFNYLWLRGEIDIVETDPVTLWQKV